MNIESIKQSIKCHVCGDKASGLNHNAYTCVSCRFFFQRNIIRIEKLKCRKDHKCQIDFSTRKCCPKCRLLKCIKIGMKINSMVALNGENSDEKHKNLQSPLNSNIFTDILEENIRKELQNEEDGITPLYSNDCVLQDFNSRKQRNYATNLISYERELIDEVQNAMNFSFEDESTLPQTGEVIDPHNGFNWPERYLKRILKFCIKITSFKLLNQSDQLIILRPFFMEILFLRFAFLYDHERNGHPIISNESGQEAVFMNFGLADNLMCQDVMQKNLKYIKMLNLELDNDGTIRDLIIAQFLFRLRKNLSCPEFVRYHHFVYRRLLRRYLEACYKNVHEANRKFSSLMNLVCKFDAVKEKLNIMFDEIDYGQLPVWLVELYKLAS